MKIESFSTEGNSIIKFKNTPQSLKIKPNTKDEILEDYIEFNLEIVPTISCIS